MKLNEPYLRQDFTDFLNKFLPDFEKDVRKARFEGLSAISNVAYLGKSRKIDLQIFELTHKLSPNARVALATDGFRVMKQSASFRSLVVYYSNETQDWRLSLMTLIPEVSEKGKVAVQFSNPRRFSFFLGPNAKINTPYNFLIKKGKITDFEDLKSRFSLEVVNKEFYQEIAELYNKLVGGVRGTGKKERRYKGIIKLPSVASGSQTNHEFAVRLIGRIIFCWFLREKKSKSGLSLVPKKVLSLDSAQTTKDFYHSILEPLFFEILNKQVSFRKEQYAKDFYPQIPYLNGGLFSPQDDDYYSFDEGKQAVNHNTVQISDDWFVELFEVLEKYNFTVDENTSVDVDLSIDPEMLGRIFENLLAEINPETGESARKGTGSYYTPRSIVEYMVDESIFQFLKEKTGIDEKKLRALSSYDISDDENSPLNEGEKEKVIESLSNITILDPTCGSGAFPIGALQKIVFMLQRVDPDAKLWFQRQVTTTTPEVKKLLEHEFEHKNLDYIRKLGVIRKSIFGVDIQPIATEISRLRCFLTLVVEEAVDDDEPNRGVEPLPNLDFKFVTANSLIGLPKTNTSQQAIFDDYQKIDELKSVRDQFFHASDIKREQLKTEFTTQQRRLLKELQKEHGWTGVAKAELTQKLTDWEPFTHKPSSWFDPEWMFGIKGGFDIVIANPPYISYGLRGTQKMTSEERKRIVTLFPNSAEYKISIYALFMDKATQLSNPRYGIQTYIVPDSFLLGRYFSKVRSWILKNNEIIQISWLPYKIFGATVGYSVIYTFQRRQIVNSSHKVVSRIISSNEQIPNMSYKEYSYPQSYFENLKHSRFRLFFDSKTKSLVEKIELGSEEVGKYYIGRTGVRSLIGQKNIKGKEKKSETWQPGLTSGSQITKYRTVYDGDYINIDPKLLNKGGWDYEVIHNPKILLRQTGDHLTAAIDYNNYYHFNNIHSFALRSSNSTVTLNYLLSLLNSELLNWYYKTTTLEAGRTMAQTDIETVESLPTKNLSEQAQEPFIHIVDKILAVTKSEDYLENSGKQAQVKEYEKQIDQMVYKLYELTPEEIEIVEGNTK